MGVVRSVLGPVQAGTTVALVFGQTLAYPDAVATQYHDGLLTIVDSNGDCHFLPRFTTLVIPGS